MKKLDSRGFTHFEIALLILVIAALGFAGYTVLQNNKTAESTTSALEPVPTQSRQTSYQTPDGYTAYQNKDLGFAFDYPSQYGQFTKEVLDPAYASYYKDASILKASAALELSAGISKDIRLWQYSNNTTSIDSRKYGPKIQLKNNKWIVTEANESDVNQQKVGDEYRDGQGNALRAQNRNGLVTYLFNGGDEGVLADNLVFVANNKLYKIELSFDTGTYGDQAVQNDQKPYDIMLRTIQDSIRTAR